MYIDFVYSVTPWNVCKSDSGQMLLRMERTRETPGTFFPIRELSSSICERCSFFVQINRVIVLFHTEWCSFTFHLDR